MRTWGAVALVLFVIAGSAFAWWWLRADARPVMTVSQTAQVDGLFITLGLDKELPGSRVIEIAALDSTGKPADVSAVQLRFTMIQMDMGTTTVDATRVSNGLFRAQGPFFAMVGSWQVEATLQRPGHAPALAPFTFAIAAPGETSGPLNPLTADAATLAAGQQLYAANCATCHGATGGGDGPAAAGLNPRPSNFHQHMTPGLHTDGQIYTWIQDGYPNSAMPAWGQKLNAEQIWQLVTYLRTFGQTSTSASGQPAQDATPTPTFNLLPVTQEPLPPLVFARNGNVWRSAGDGTPPRQLTTLDGGQYAQFPIYTPDDSQIAFVAIAPPAASATNPLPTAILYVMATDGTGLRAVWRPNNGVLGMPTWSADGTALYVGFNGLQPAANGNGSTRLVQVVRIDVATGATQPALEDALDPALAPDGKQFVYLKLAQNASAMALEVASLDGSNARQLVNSQMFAGLHAPRFSPDGKRIVFAAYGGPLANSDRPSAAPSLGEALLDLFAPAVVEAHSPPTDLWEVNIDGSGLHRLVALQDDTPMAAFSPDGQELAVMSANGIYRLNADGTHLRRIDALGDHGGLDWARR